MDHATRQQRISDGYEISEKREDLADRHGKSIEEARELWSKTAKSACCCAECFLPLSPTNSVTMQGRVVAGSARHGNQRWVRVPVCLLCTLNGIRHNWMGLDVHYETPRWHRARCLNCARPIRIHGYSLNAQTCCTDCKHAMRNIRNKLRRRVEHAPIKCIECRRPFTPKRADAKTCSNKCRQAQHRKQVRSATSAELHWHGGITVREEHEDGSFTYIDNPGWHDDPRGEEFSRYVIRPVMGKSGKLSCYVVSCLGEEIGKARSLRKAEEIAAAAEADYAERAG